MSSRRGARPPRAARVRRGAGAGAIVSRSASRRSDCFTGLLSRAAMARSACRRSGRCGTPADVSRITFVDASWAAPRISRATSDPSTPGICASMSATAQGAPAAAASRSIAMPAPAVSAAPGTARHSRSTPSSTVWVVRLSSTMSTRRPRSPSGTGVSWPGPSARANRSANEKRLPCPAALASEMRPPISSTSWAEMVSPSPVPPKRRVVDASACTNGPKICHCLSGATPMPVSDTAKRSDASCAVTAWAATSTTTSPCSVNLTAFPTRLRITCRRRPGSPSRASGTAAAIRHANSSCFSWACGPSNFTASSTVSRRLKGTWSSCMRPASTFDTSRMSFRIASSASAD